MICDWLQFTIKGFDFSNVNYSQVADFVLGYLPSSLSDFIISNNPTDLQYPFFSIEGSVNLYSKSFSYINGVRVCFDGISDNMGVNVIISGSVLRNCQITNDDIIRWWHLFKSSNNISLSRVDIAFDTTEIDFDVFLQSFFCKNYISKTRNNSVCLNSDNRGTIYFGSRGSRCHIRIYDKRVEQISKARSDSDRADLLLTLPKIWSRVEFQFRHELCSFVLDKFCDNNFSDYANGFLRFIESSDVKNLSRDSVICKWWSDILGSEDIEVLYYRKESNFNYEAFVKNVVPQIKALISEAPEIYNQAISEGSLSSRTLDNLKKDKILGYIPI